MANDLMRPPPRAALSAVRGTVADLVTPALAGVWQDLRRPRARSASAAVPRTSFDPRRPENIADPHAALARLREHPVVVNEDLDVWMMSRHRDVHAATRDNETFTSREGVVLRSFALKTVVFVDPPDHTRLRKIAVPLFTKRAVRDLERDIAELAADGIAPLRSGEVVDMVRSLTIPLPINVIAAMLGIPRDQWPGFRAVSEQFSGILGPSTAAEMIGLMGSAVPAYVRFRSFIEAEMRSRAVEPAQDLITRFQQAEAAGELSDSEAFIYALLLLIAGNETTTSLLGILLMKLAQEPRLFAELKADRSLVPGAVEEALRWGSPIQWVTRTLTTDHEIGGAVIPQGGRVMLFYSGANRDPARFDDPDRFDVRRDTSGHVAFGHGLHFCLGAHLARLEAITAVNRLLGEADGLELAGPVSWSTTPSLSGPVSLPIRIRRGGASN
jgi:cytochrome P450